MVVPSQPVIPELPERFSGVRPLGEGEQAVTVAARDERSGRDVVIKVLDLSHVRDWKAFERFEREHAVLESLEHPSVPVVLERVRDEERGLHLLVMERIPGRSLAEDLAAGRRRTEAQLLELLERLLDVLEYLHSLHPPVIHRDIKPANVVVRPDGLPVLVDFGAVAKVFQPQGSSTVVGTFGYMAPEQLYGRISPGSDLYALGATLAAVAAGEEAEVLPRRGLEVDLEDAIAPGVLRSVLEALLRSDPDERPASVAEVRALLERLRDPSGDLDDDSSPSWAELPAVASPTSPARTDEPRSMSRLWLELGVRGRITVVAYVWVVILVGVMTRAILLGVLLVLLLPLVMGASRTFFGDDS